jgi:hypothetical protein
MTDSESPDTSESRLQEVSGHRMTGEPIVLEYRRKKGGKSKKYRYSRGVRGAQRMERDLSRIVLRQSRALTKGVETYVDARDKSAAAKRDGALRDFIPNMGDAWAEGMAEASELPRDIARLLNSRGNRRALRRQLRMISSPVRMMRR